MKKFKQYIILVLFLLVGVPTYTQDYIRNGNIFISSKGERVKSEVTKTKFTWKDSKGKEYPVYVSNSGSCFVIKTSAKTGKEYRNYLGPEISQQICKELGINYKSRKRNDNN